MALQEWSHDYCSADGAMKLYPMTGARVHVNGVLVSAVTEGSTHRGNRKALSTGVEDMGGSPQTPTGLCQKVSPTSVEGFKVLPPVDADYTTCPPIGMSGDEESPHVRAGPVKGELLPTITEPTVLSRDCRILFGRRHLFRLDLSSPHEQASTSTS